MTFPNHINEMHAIDFPDYASLVPVPEITEEIGTWEMPEVQYAGEFTTELPVNEFIAHVMNCGTCERDVYTLENLAQFFSTQSKIMMHQEALNNSAAIFPAFNLEMQRAIIQLESDEADTYKTLITRVNSLHAHDIDHHLTYTLHGKVIAACNCGDYLT